MTETEAHAQAHARERELEGSQMPFLEHLRELRIRLRNSTIAALAGFAVAFYFKQDVFNFLVRPLDNVLVKLSSDYPDVFQQAMHYTSVIEPVWTFFGLAFWAGLFVSSPFVFHQIWKFIAPGLYKNERLYGIGFACTSAILFTTGAAFCYYFVLEDMYSFFLSYSVQNLDQMAEGLQGAPKSSMTLVPLLTMGEYLSFAKKFLIGFGFIFELPLLIFFLSLTGTVTHRSLWKFNRYAVVLSFVVAAILTPPEVLSQVAMAGPIVVMYNVSIIIAWIVTVRRERKERREHLRQ